MKLKEYQIRVINELKNYLDALCEAQGEYARVASVSANAAKFMHPPQMAWETATSKIHYVQHFNGLKEPIADVYYKIPTGGGKTLLACHSIDYIQRILFQRNTGLVLWIMPTTEIFRQTAKALKNRRHPYRQYLDMATANKVLIKEKNERFTKNEVNENLVILLMMLPSANRENKQSLRVFRDSGGFTDFFPAEDQWEAQENLLKAIPNLDFFGNTEGVVQKQIMTSLGNAVRISKPLVIIDEGHKAYSEKARDTITNLNPCFILQLSATPPLASNRLVEVSGRDLDREQMIKLDIHLHNKQDNPDWKDTMTVSLTKRNELEKIALEYQQNGGNYIRPINLIQVQQTGEKLVNDTSKIHAEHVKKYLIEQCGISPQHIAVKTSENDGLEGIDLMEEGCEIRYIITKQALQEGWDCPFAYILTILSNSVSETGLTQLIGRVLRQPYAQDTGIKDLDECYVYTFRQSSTQLANSIKANLEKEGMGDLAGSISIADANSSTTRDIQFREKFKKFEGDIYLPKFYIKVDNKNYRELMYEADILRGIDWDKLDLTEILTFNPSTNEESKSTDFAVNYNELDVLSERTVEVQSDEVDIDLVFMTRQLGDIVPNPWWAYEFAQKIVTFLIEKHGQSVIASNFVRLIEFCKQKFEKQRDLLGFNIFHQLIDDKKLIFLLQKREGGYFIPNRIPVRGENVLNHGSNTKLVQRTLFDGEPDEDYNGFERSVALCLDKQGELLWWYRNRVGEKYYSIKGWQPRKIYPDFVASKKSPNIIEDDFDHVFVMETKGNHLKGNDDTLYKENLLNLCSDKTWGELVENLGSKNFTFQVIYQDEYEQVLSKNFA
jgi:type III restriction enzyme